MLSLENTSSRMSHLARQEIYFDRQFGLDETLQGVERVTAEDVQRVAADLFKDGSSPPPCSATSTDWKFHGNGLSSIEVQSESRPQGFMESSALGFKI